MTLADYVYMHLQYYLPYLEISFQTNNFNEHALGIMTQGTAVI
jgi:hypothetical protein